MSAGQHTWLHIGAGSFHDDALFGELAGQERLTALLRRTVDEVRAWGGLV